MSRWRRGAEISKNLIIGLVVIVVAAGVFWAWKAKSTTSEKAQTAKAFEKTEYKLSCSKCGKVFTIPAAQAKEMDKDRRDGKLKCPECGTYTAKWGTGTGGIREVEQPPTQP